MAAYITRNGEYYSALLEDVELTPKIREILGGLDPSAQEHKQAISLPPACYTSEEWFEFEKRAVFDRDWVCVGHTGLIPNPGDFQAINMNNDPLIVLRDRAGVPQARRGYAARHRWRASDDESRRSARSTRRPRKRVPRAGVSAARSNRRGRRPARGTWWQSDAWPG